MATAIEEHHLRAGTWKPRLARLDRTGPTVPLGSIPACAPATPPWTGIANALVVLAGELDDKQRRSKEPLADLRDLLPALCLDLSTTKAGKATLEVHSDLIDVACRCSGSRRRATRLGGRSRPASPCCS